MIDHLTRLPHRVWQLPKSIQKTSMDLALLKWYLEKNPKFPVSLNSKMPALGVTTSQVAADNLNAIHAARQAFIQNESRENIQLALTNHFKTSEDDAYTTKCFTKEKIVKQWHGPGPVIGQVGKQILVKHGFTYVRVHICRITHTVNNDQNEIQWTSQDYRENSSNNESRSNQLISRSIEIYSSDEELSEEPDNNSNMNINAINQNNDNELPVTNNVDDMNKKQAGVKDLTKPISRWLTNQIQEL